MAGSDRKKKRTAGSIIRSVVFGVLFVSSLCLLMYPLAVREYEKYREDRVITTFTQLAEEVQAEETAEETADPEGSDAADETVPDAADGGFTPDPDSYQELRQAMEEYNESIYENGQSGLVDAWSYQQAQFDLSAWGIPDDILGYVEIPSIDSRLPVYLGATNANMRKGAVCLGQTSLPIGGTNTACVLAAHRGYSGIAMWRNIEGVSIGDTVTLTNLWETLTYTVTEIKIIWPYEIDKVLIQPGKDMLILTTCHPYRGHSKYRYVVYCERADSLTGTAGTGAETAPDGTAVISESVSETEVQGINGDDIGVSTGITFESSENDIFVEDMLQYAAAGTAGAIILIVTAKTIKKKAGKKARRD